MSTLQAAGKLHLPYPRGPHNVGFIDTQTKTIPTRIYYPTQQNSKANPDLWPKWTEDEYISGLLNFMKSMSHRWPSWAPRGEFEHFDTIRTLVPWIPHQCFPALFRLMNGQVYLPILPQAELNKDQKWPLVVFSHGLGAARFIYSQLCSDLASQGFIVIAPEHQDGSACLSYQIDNAGQKWKIPHRRIEVHENEYFVRHGQVQQRSLEVVQALELGLNLNSHPGFFQDTMDVSHPVMIGHSFGGATALLALHSDPRFKVGIILDGWLFPLSKMNDLKIRNQNVMFVNAEGFLNAENLNLMQKVTEKVEKKSCHYIKGSVHQSFLDVPLVIRNAKLKKILGMHSSTCPQVTLSLTNKLMVQFINKALGVEVSQDIQQGIAEHDDLVKSGFGTDHCILQPHGKP